jgi:hypothetical protein
MKMVFACFLGGIRPAASVREMSSAAVCMSGKNSSINKGVYDGFL